MNKITLQCIMTKINSIKLIDCFNFYTNYFFNKLDDEVYYYENEKAIIFLQPESDFYHLYFACTNLDYLEKLFEQIDLKADIAVEIICKNKIDDFLFKSLSKYFEYQTTYNRTKLYNLRERPYKKEPLFATENDVEFIHNQLRAEFNKYFDHFPSRETLIEYIKNNWVIVKKDENNNILAYIIFTIANKSCHFNYMKNLTSDSFILISLIDQFYNKIIKLDVNNVYLWVDMDNNSRVRKLHEFYGHKFDGTLNVTFLKKSLH